MDGARQKGDRIPKRIGYISFELLGVFACDKPVFFRNLFYESKTERDTQLFPGALRTFVEKINSRVKESAARSQFKPAGLSVNNFLLLPLFLTDYLAGFSDILTISSSSISAASTGPPVSNTMASSTVFRRPTKYTTQIIFLH